MLIIFEDFTVQTDEISAIQDGINSIEAGAYRTQICLKNGIKFGSVVNKKDIDKKLREKGLAF